MTKNRDEALDLFNNLPKYDVKPGLDRIEFLLSELGNPTGNIPTIHVAGSNGKGSVVAMLSGALSQNHSVGEFLSPPLRGFSDRIVVDGNPIGKPSIARGIDELAGPISKLKRTGNEPSFFEAATALGAWYFDREDIDIALLEAGLGGKYDATNPVGDPVLSAVTSVDLEHQNILGDSIEEIAHELAGIGKPGKPLVLGPTKRNIATIFREECRETGSRLVRAEDVTAVTLREFDWSGSRFLIDRTSVTGLAKDTLELGLAGTYQGRNLVTALTILGELSGTEFETGLEEIKTGLREARWAGRFQTLEEHPYLLVDGAHNEAASRLLADELTLYRSLLPEGAKVKLVFSALNPAVDEIYLTELDMPRAAPLKALERWANRIDLKYRLIESPKKAIRIAKEEAKKEDLICVTGSLYLVREAIGSENRRKVG